MEKVYTIDKDQILKYKMRNIFRVIKVIMAILFLFFLINLLTKQNNWEPLIITALYIFGLVIIVGFIALLKKDTVFESYTIRLKNDCIFREGRLYHSDLINTNIDLSQIGKLKKVTNGYLIYKKDSYRLFKFHPYKMIGIYDNDIIWIPFILNNYNELIDLLKKRKIT